MTQVADGATPNGVGELCRGDRICINKATNDELTTAINSMFRWYQRAAKCYVFLSDVAVPHDVADPQLYRITWENAFRKSRWFTRGWTLQELLAPASVEFFSKEGRRLGSKISLEQEVHETTQVPFEVLRGQCLSKISVDERMSWMARRKTTIKEDKAYCLLGIFGVFMPLIYGEGEDHAFLRLKEEVQKLAARDKQGSGDTQNTAISSLLPFPRNKRLVGRGAQLQALEERLLPLRSHRRISIYGLGGEGKTALALKFAYRTMAKYPRCLVFWVPTISRESFELAYRDIGIRLRILGITDDNADVKRLVKEELDKDGLCEWLMIVDNADDQQILTGRLTGNAISSRLMEYLPHRDRGAILFTTRGRKAAYSLTESDVLELEDLDKPQARQLIALRIANKALLSDEKAVDKLLTLLTNLPLAIVQAAAYINSNDIPVSEYISLFQRADSEAELFSEHFEDSDRYQEMESTIAKTWHISFDQIRRQDPLAADYLSFIACIDHINIPESLLPVEGSVSQRIKAIGTLTGYAFLAERRQGPLQLQGQKFFDVHRLVQLPSVWWLEEHSEWTTWVEKAAFRLEELIPYGGHDKRELWVNYLSHAIHLASSQSTLADTARAGLLDRVGRCQATLGQYSRAETTHRQVLSLRKRSLGSENTSTLTSMNEVGLALSDQGKYEAAERMHEQTLARSEKVLGPEHPDTLTSTNNLAGVLDRQGKYEEAESMNKQTLARREKVLGPEHPDTLTSMSDLAGVLNRQGKYEEARSMNRQTLARREKVLGPEHPDTLTSVYCLAHLLTNIQRYDESTGLYERAYTRYSAILGKDHPTTRACRQHNSDMLASQQQDRLALPLEIPRSEVSMDNANDKASRLSRGLAKIGIGRIKGHK